MAVNILIPCIEWNHRCRKQRFWNQIWTNCPPPPPPPLSPTECLFGLQSGIEICLTHLYWCRRTKAGWVAVGIINLPCRILRPPNPQPPPLPCPAAAWWARPILRRRPPPWASSPGQTSQPLEPPETTQSSPWGLAVRPCQIENKVYTYP